MEERHKVFRIIFLYGSATDPFDQLRRITHDKGMERPEFKAFRKSHPIQIDVMTFDEAPELITEAALKDGVANECAVLIRLESGSHVVMAEHDDIIWCDDVPSLIEFLRKNAKECSIDMGFPA